MDDAPASQMSAPLLRRLVWFFSLWAGSVLTLGVIAGILRAWLKTG